MLRLAKLLACVLVATMFYVAPAHAQATRTWVSGVGDDVNPCSRTAPCKTFPGAISKTAAGGEIDCLDPGGFGGVTIIKSITLDCTGTFGSILVSGTPGITVNGANINVIVRGISIQGVGLGTNGINFVQGASLVVDNVLIQNFQGFPAVGINFQPSSAATLSVHNTTITNNGTTGQGGGIRIQPTGSGSARVALRDVRIENSTNSGLTVDSTGNTGPGITMSLDNVEVAGNGSGVGIALSAPAGTTTIGVMVNNSTVANNSVGFVANGATLTGRVANTTITGNGTGLLVVGGATLSSYGNNRLDGNPTVGAPNNGSFTGGVLPPH